MAVSGDRTSRGRCGGMGATDVFFSVNFTDSNNCCRHCISSANPVTIDNNIDNSWAHCLSLATHLGGDGAGPALL